MDYQKDCGWNEASEGEDFNCDFPEESYVVEEAPTATNESILISALAIASNNTYQSTDIRSWEMYANHKMFYTFANFAVVSQSLINDGFVTVTKRSSKFGSFITYRVSGKGFKHFEGKFQKW